MVFHVAAAQGEKLLDQMRQSDDGGACIKGETILLVHIGPPAGRIQLLQHLNVVSLDAQTNSCCQTAKACADHDRCGAVVVQWIRPDGWNIATTGCATPIAHSVN